MGRIFVFTISVFMLFVLVLLFILVKPSFALVKCPVNMVKIGKLCVDKYEASVWSQRPDAEGNPRGIQYGVDVDDYPCVDNGNNCTKNKPGKIFAVSAPGEMPSSSITWFQAQQACANVEKRLLRNGEWQMAAAGTPDGDLAICNISGGLSEPTGSIANCVSNWGVFDMMGNVTEWVEDWVQPNTGSNGNNLSNDLYGNDGIFGIDDAAGQGGGQAFPAAIMRGGNASSGTADGVFALSALLAPSFSGGQGFGFRCAK